ncbi:unnamed protein product, partial [Brassica rapa]
VHSCFLLLASYTHRLCLDTSILRVLTEGRALWIMDQVKTFI